MSGTNDGDRPVTAAELAAVTGALEEIRQGMQELRDANTPAERREASQDLSDARGDLDQAAKRLGISRETLEKAARDARTAERREELRPILQELLQEARDADEAAAATDPGKDPAGKAKPKPKPKEGGAAAGLGDPPPEDTGPAPAHWSEKHVGELVR